MEIKYLEGETSYSFDGEGGNRSKNIDTSENITVKWNALWIDIAVSASTFTSNYMLTIEKTLNK